MQRDGLFNFVEVDEWDKCIDPFIVLKPLIKIIVLYYNGVENTSPYQG